MFLESAEYRRLKKMQKEREKEQEKELKDKRKKQVVGLAAAAGIGYAAFKNKDRLAANIQSVVGKSKVVLSRTTESAAFRGKITETKNLSEAFGETYGNLSPKELIHTLSNRKERSKQFESHLSYLNKNRLNDKLKNNMPKDLSQMKEVLGNVRMNHRKAYQEASKDILKEVLEQKKYKEAFGKNAGALQEVLEENPQLLYKDLKNGLQRKDGVYERMPKELLDTFNKYNHNSSKTNSFNIPLDNKKAQKDFVENMFNVAAETREKTMAQVDAFKKGVPGEDNIYGAYRSLFDFTSLEGLRRGHAGENNSFMAKSLKKEGFKNVTMGEAQNLYVVENNGRFKVASKDTKNAKRFELLFEPTINKDETVGIADRYLEEGRKAGFKVEDLKKDRFSDYLYINNKTGEFLNTSGPENLMNETLDYVQSNYQIPILRVNPLDMTQRNLKNQQDHGLRSMVYQSGTPHPYIKGDIFSVKPSTDIRNKNSVGVIEKAYFQIDDKIYDSSIIDKIKGKTGPEAAEAIASSLDDYMLDSGYKIQNVAQGHAKRMAEVYSGRTNLEPSHPSTTGGKVWDNFKEIAGLKQENESNFGKIKRAFDKFEAPDGPDNLLNSHRELLKTNPEDAAELLNTLDYKLSSRSQPLSREGRKALHDTMAETINKELNPLEAIDPLDFTTNEGLFGIAEKISKAEIDYSGSNKSIMSGINENIQEEIRSTFNFNKDNPEAYFRRQRMLKDQGSIGDVIQNAVGETKSSSISSGDDLRRLIEQYSISILDKNGDSQTINNKILESTVTGKKEIQKEIESLRSQSISSFFKNKQDNVETVQDLIRVQADFEGLMAYDSSFKSGMQNALHRAEPWNTAGIEPKEERLLGGTFYTPIKEGKSLFNATTDAYQNRPFESPQSASEEFDNMKSYAKKAAEYANQAFGFGGEVTERSVVPWNIADNLDKRMQDLGLGLPNHMKKNAASIMMNQFGRRIVLPYVLYQQAKWADDTFFDGEGKKELAGTYANMHEDVSKFKEMTGLNEMGRSLRDVMPWMENIDETPIAKAFNFATFGALSDFRKPEEIERYYESGEDAIRKGRYWDVGSTGAWMGGRIDRYEPNWYRKVMSDYRYTDTMYGSADEYWANNWMPTLTHPFAPVRHFITDPYHWEEKHAESRPYAVTGGFSELQMIPVIGPILDRGVSSVLKPARINPRLKSEQDRYYNEYQANIAQSYINANAAGVMNVNPGGGVVLSSDTYDLSYRNEDGELDEEYLYADDLRFRTERNRIGSGSPSKESVIVEETPNVNPLTLSPVQLDMLEKTYGEENIAPVAAAPGNTFTSSDFAMQEIAYRNTIVANQKMQRPPRMSQIGRTGSPTMVENIEDTYDPNAVFSKHGAIEGIKDDLSSFAGLYGFVTKTFSRFDISDKRNRYLETSDMFTDYSRAFWSNEFGGFGGDLSEIGRRYVNDSKQENRYNPIRNNMPSWLPGPEYFIDFQHGDPFRKIDKGEIRLPSEAYESLYNVRKDEFGNYSAFDRYRILADIAPYSDQYRLAKKEVALLNQNNLLGEEQQEEYREIRKQVTSKMKKNRFYERKFDNAEINTEHVTVTKIIDQNTFLTKEYGNNPMKLAGVQVRSDDKENIELIKSIIKPGARLKVGIDADPQNRVRDDMLETMRVVVYAGMQNPLDFSMDSLNVGENLNYKLSKQSKENGGKVLIRNDGSAVATRALTSEGYLTIGKASEKLVHDIIPNIPIVNIFADKYIPVRSPLEAYKKDIYSKSFRDWKQPVEGWIKPMLETGASLNPLLSATQGAGIGYLMGRKNKWNKAAGLGMTFGVISGIRSTKDFIDEFTPGEKQRWIPKRREKEREVDEYFDKIQYVKYKGLYEKAKELAKKKEGVDLDKFFSEKEANGKNNKRIQSYLKEKKKWLTITKKTEPLAAETAKEELEKVNEQLKSIDDDRPTASAGSYTALALRYKEEYESTLYGATDTYDYLKIYRALPKKDKEYFTAFQKASPKERQEILSLVPKNQRRVYQQQFGMKVDDKESLDDYFSQYDMPDENWEGWRPEVSLDNIKVKVMKEEGIDLTESNYWEEDEMQAEESGVQPIDIEKVNGRMSSFINKGKLEAALKGAGLKDVRVQMTTSASDMSYFSTSLNIQREREEEIEEGMQEYLASS